ncbi:L-serine ammonia-lyase [Aeromonas veronii]|uniref:L-serine ammonia-lyase n=1 Tax=Aeromonas veronii TaxID=654 RepID=UPI0007B5BC8B|nr:L-serine ammonia-lyase [Aeromonas veronii]ANB69444.1 L-serine ammonia-lyase [Aeromonas veronii]PSJ88049.1 L-serine ammonia-lyase [Aeromonas veronii]
MISVFDLFSIGIGPSSSHTVGPMRASYAFVQQLKLHGHLPHTARVEVECYGSLGQTGKGHGTGKAIILGLSGFEPESVDIDAIPAILAHVEKEQSLQLAGEQPSYFPRIGAIIFNRRKTLPAHTNGMTLRAFDKEENLRFSQTYYSIGGGFIIEESHFATAKEEAAKSDAEHPVPYPFDSGAQLLAHCQESGLSISGLILANERVFRSDEQIKAGLRKIWQAMQGCVERGCKSEGVLPGGLKVRRRAPGLFRQLSCETNFNKDPLMVMEWVDLFALAVNEENAAGGRVVTAPTNGAAGIIPAVLHYYDRFVHKVDDETLIRYFLTAAAIGILYKKNASLSGAEVGCQGEVGVACSMAAGALTELLGGSPAMVENAAEIGMEHNLGLTCDPIGGLVQVPCIERNAMGAVKAINAARLALRGTGEHKVSLDKVIKTMWETGNDMKTKYKETARGGLAVNITEC